MLRRKSGKPLSKAASGGNGIVFENGISPRNIFVPCGMIEHIVTVAYTEIHATGQPDIQADAQATALFAEFVLKK